MCARSNPIFLRSHTRIHWDTPQRLVSRCTATYFKHMANLLPTKELAALKAEQHRRLLASVLALVAGLCVFGTILLIPAGVVLFSSKGAVEERLESTRQLVALQQTASSG